MTRRASSTHHGLVMAGGGARGAYGVGVAKALLNGESPTSNYEPVDPVVYSGTSAGAYNVAVLTSRAEDPIEAVEYLEHIWRDEIPRQDEGGSNRVYRYRADPTQFINTEYLSRNPLGPAADLVRDTAFLSQDLFRRGVNFMLSPGALQRRILELMEIAPIFSVEPLEHLIDETVDFEKIRTSKKKIRVPATNWKAGAVRVFHNDEMIDGLGKKAVLASASVPGIFAPVAINGEPYVDGGTVMNTPLNPAIDAGADTLHVIYQDPQVEAMPLLNVRNTIDTMNRLLIITLASKMNADIANAAKLNKAVVALEKARRHEEIPTDEANELVLMAANLKNANLDKYRKLTIHRYHPHDDLGGIFKMLSFGRDTVNSLVDRGFRDALLHDCTQSECVIPE